MLRGRNDRALHRVVALRLRLPLQETPARSRSALPGSQAIRRPRSNIFKVVRSVHVTPVVVVTVVAVKLKIFVVNIVYCCCCCKVSHSVSSHQS